MKARWTFRCYPTPEQAQHLARTFGCVRFVWNWGLRLRSDGYRAGERIGYPETDKRLTVLKRQPETVWLNEVSSVCLQQSLRDLQVAYSNFFDKLLPPGSGVGIPSLNGGEDVKADPESSQLRAFSFLSEGCASRDRVLSDDELMRMIRNTILAPRMTPRRKLHCAKKEPPEG